MNASFVAIIVMHSLLHLLHLWAGLNAKLLKINTKKYEKTKTDHSTLTQQLRF